MEQMRRQHHTSRLWSRLWNRQIGHLLSYECWHEGLEGREALLNRSLPLLEQCQRELGDLLLERHDLRFQAGQFLGQVCFRLGGSKERTGCGSSLPLVFRPMGNADL